MQLIPQRIPDVVLIKPKLHGDERGFFQEVWQQRRYEEQGIARQGFVQLNHSRSSQGILRGLHFQLKRPQGKLVRVLRGSVLDVAVDLRPKSPDFGRWVSAVLDDHEHAQLWVPEGFAHGFCVLSESADFEYSCTELYHPEDEGMIRWNDPDLDIDWMVEEPVFSSRDGAAAGFLEQIPLFKEHYSAL